MENVYEGLEGELLDILLVAEEVYVQPKEGTTSKTEPTGRFLSLGREKEMVHTTGYIGKLAVSDATAIRFEFAMEYDPRDSSSVMQAKDMINLQAENPEVIGTREYHLRRNLIINRKDIWTSTTSHTKKE